MSESKEKKSTATATNMGRLPMAIIGLAVVFAIALLVNFLVGKTGTRFDLTENKVFTLSDGTRNILSKLDTPVTLRYYVNDDAKVMSPMERSYARRVEDLLNEYVRNSPVKEIEIVNKAGEFEKQNVRMLTVKKLNPEPNTDAEDAAVIDGLQAGLSRETNSEIFFGIAIECVDSRETIPFIPAKEETLLEYDLSRAISSVHGGKAKKILVMSGMKVGGGMGANFQAPPKPAWIFYEQLGKDYEMKAIPATTEVIPPDTSTLIVLHPFDITDKAQFAIDQYLLNGGNVIALVDPNFFYARALQPQGGRPGMPPQQPGPGPSSSLDKLFSAWGVSFDSTKVLADLNFGTEILRRGNFSPTFLTLDRKAIGAEGITVDTLVQSSPINQLINSTDADPTKEGGADSIRKDFKPTEKPAALVVRLSGDFVTAFPEGDPTKKAAEEEKKADKKDPADKAKDAKKEEKDDALKKSVKPGRVILFADVDFIYDETCVRRSTIPGMNIQTMQALNENLTLLQNATEQLSGDPDLINVRSRNSARRPFTKQSEWYREAQDKYKVELASFQEQKKASEAKLSELIQSSPENMDKALLSKEVQAELKELQQKAISFGKKERELQKEVTREFRRKLALYKFGNALFMPIIVILFGIALAVIRRRKTAAH